MVLSAMLESSFYLRVRWLENYIYIYINVCLVHEKGFGCTCVAVEIYTFFSSQVHSHTWYGDLKYGEFFVRFGFHGEHACLAAKDVRRLKSFLFQTEV